MRATLGLLLGIALLASACGDTSNEDEADRPEVIARLASMDLSVHDVEVCKAVTEGGLEDDLKALMGVDDIELTEESSYSEYDLSQWCYVTWSDHDPSVKLLLSQGADIDNRVGADDPYIYPGCQVSYYKTEGQDVDKLSPGIGAVCHWNMSLGFNVEDQHGDMAVPVWPQAGIRRNADKAYLDFLHDLLASLSKQG